MSCVELQEKLQAQGKHDCFDTATVAREGGKRFALQNRNNKAICRVRVDDCLIVETGRKCDYLFRVSPPVKYYLVELKGVNIDHGVQQIISTFETVNSKIKAKAEDYKGIIVSSSVPAATPQKFRKLQEKYYREKKLLIRKTHIEHVEPV